MVQRLRLRLAQLEAQVASKQASSTVAKTLSVFTPGLALMQDATSSACVVERLLVASSCFEIEVMCPRGCSMNPCCDQAEEQQLSDETRRNATKKIFGMALAALACTSVVICLAQDRPFARSAFPSSLPYRLALTGPQWSHVWSLWHFADTAGVASILPAS